ncbi:hypothetical protein PO909_009824 [Leuciscus waleckii]
MIQGVPAFPGMKDIQDQLERIFLIVLHYCLPKARLLYPASKRGASARDLLIDILLPERDSDPVHFISPLFGCFQLEINSLIVKVNYPLYA